MTMQARVIELEIDENDTPIVPVGVTVTPQADGHWTVQGEASPAPTHASARYHPAAAHLWEAEPGLYAVAAEPEWYAFLGWADEGQPMVAYCAGPGGDTWPLKNGSTCAISSIIGSDDPRPGYQPPQE